MTGLLVLGAALATFFEKKLFGTTYLPVTLIFWPIIAAVLFLDFFGEACGFYAFDATQVTPLLWGLMAVLIGEFIAASLKNSLLRCSPDNHAPGLSERYQIKPTVLRTVVLVMLIVGFIRLAYLVRSSGLSIYLATDGLEASLLRGPIAHLILIGYVLCPMLLKAFFDTRSKLSLLIWFGYVVLMFFTMVKYHAIFLIIASVIYCVITNTVSLRKLLPVLIVLPIAIFMVNYIANFAGRGTVAQDGYLTDHLLNYLLGGVLYSSVMPASMMGSDVTPLNLLISQLMTFPNMIWSGLFGEGLFEITSTPYMLLGPNGQIGNVCNIITLFFYRGYVASGITCLVLQSFVWTLFIYKARNKALSAFVATALFLAFFGDYFMLSPVWEVFILVILVPILLRLLATKIRVNYVVCK